MHRTQHTSTDPIPGFELTSQRVRGFRSYQLNHRGDRHFEGKRKRVNVRQLRSEGVSDGSRLALYQTLSIECPSSIFLSHVLGAIVFFLYLSFDGPCVLCQSVFLLLFSAVELFFTFTIFFLVGIFVILAASTAVKITPPCSAIIKIS